MEPSHFSVIGQPNQTIPTQYVMNEVGATATTEVVGPELVNTQPTKKRKVSASGSRQSFACWEHFIRLPYDLVDTPTSACKNCHKKYLCDPRTHGTTNMNHHILKCAKKPRTTYPTQTILTYPSVEGYSLGHVSSKFDKQACRKALSIFVVLDAQLFNAVEGEGFKYYSKVMQPQFTLPSRRTVARDCFQLHLDEKQKLKAFFKSDSNRVTLTTDCWTSIQNQNYLTLTAHFVDNEWNYQKRIISFTVIPNHKGDTVGRKIEEVLRDWGIIIVSTITVDNATSNDVAVAYLHKKISTMNGMMGDEKLCLDVSTRWNATYLMLEAAEKFQAAFDKLEYEESGYREFFGKATNVFSTAQSVSLHSAFHQVSAIYCELKQATMNLNGVFASVGGNMMEKYNRYWWCATKMNKLIYFGTILDPRYKLSYIEWTFKDMYGVGSVFAIGLIKSIKESLQKLYDWYKQAYDQNHNRQPLGSGENNVSNDETIAGRPSLMARADAFEQYLEEQELIDQQNELEGFYSSKCVKRDPKCDLLVWWKHNSTQYPILSTIAKDIFATPVSTVASESAFSMRGRVLETYMSSLKPEMAENLKKFLLQQEEDLYRLSHNLLVVLEKYGVQLCFLKSYVTYIL
ncbi:zinc finger BED domain-containing protein RICESLEEPER 1-like [Lathyrus oleraceus]|uniref:zinc finger BED domain-containing protein RICESLEEPER 1-like n=1 Tax=Pisum sativum TaxID=3888 RepID=UPI0021D32347|nr:zinc finger BED domain-containing protein RICESLEEPER 1-like [Pisum sativum]